MTDTKNIATSSAVVKKKEDKKTTSEKKVKSFAELWLENYENKEVLEKSKMLEFFYQGKTISKGKYLPWAVALKEFMLQGGEVLSWNICQMPLKNNPKLEKNIDLETGEVKEDYKKEVDYLSDFIYLEARWQNKVMDLYYPIIDNSGRAITVRLTADIINKNYQRGLTKLIAILSGIGYKLYEQDDTWEDEIKEKNEPIIRKDIKEKEEEQIQNKTTTNIEVVKQPKLRQENNEEEKAKEKVDIARIDELLKNY